MYQNNKIDFVIAWVDGSDQEWLSEKQKYTAPSTSDSSMIRYRDYDLLKYWFRGIEKYAPWVNKIHFITWGHIPDWLNTDHPRINIVQHSDFIPMEYLPTFSARTIELNFHRIVELSENFVYFNDDMFLTDHVSEYDFFVNNQPVDHGILDLSYKDDLNHGSAVYNSVFIVNKYFNKRRSIKSNFFKWFNLRYGSNMIRTVLLLPWNYFPGFYTDHLPNAYKKTTYKTLWEKEYDFLHNTCLNKFRMPTDVTQYVFKFWQIASGNFFPSNKRGKVFNIDLSLDQCCEAIKRNRHKMICINDSKSLRDFEAAQKQIKESFETILPNKSNFERAY